MKWRQMELGGVTGFVRGEAPWALFIHGFAGAPWDWCRVLTQLGPQRPAALIEIPGHGPQNRKPQGDWASITRALGEWLDRSSLSVGYSMGGRLLVGALSQLDSPKHAIVLGGHTGLGPQERDARRRWDLDQSSYLQNETMQEFRRRWGSLPLLKRSVRDSDEDVARLESGRGKLTVEGLAWAMRYLGSGSMPDVKESLRTKPHRITWAAGEHDSKYVALGKELAQLSSHWSHELVTGAGHACHLDNAVSITALIEALLVDA